MDQGVEHKDAPFGSNDKRAAPAAPFGSNDAPAGSQLFGGPDAELRSRPSGIAFINRSLAETNPLSGVLDLTQGAINLGLRGVNALAGTDIPPLPPAFGGSESVTAGMRAAGVQVAARPPETKGEKVAGGIGEAVSFLLPVNLATKLLVKKIPATIESTVANPAGDKEGKAGKS